MEKLKLVDFDKMAEKLFIDSKYMSPSEYDVLIRTITEELFAEHNGVSNFFNAVDAIMQILEKKIREMTAYKKMTQKNVEAIKQNIMHYLENDIVENCDIWEQHYLSKSKDAVIIDNEEEIPLEYFTMPNSDYIIAMVDYVEQIDNPDLKENFRELLQEYQRIIGRPNKNKLYEMMKSGTIVQGASLSPSITLRKRKASGLVVK